MSMFAIFPKLRSLLAKLRSLFWKTHFDIEKTQFWKCKNLGFQKFLWLGCCDTCPKKACKIPYYILHQSCPSDVPFIFFFIRLRQRFSPQVVGHPILWQFVCFSCRFPLDQFSHHSPDELIGGVRLDGKLVSVRKRHSIPSIQKGWPVGKKYGL